MGPFYLAAWLAQLQAEGNTIFLVLGTLPTASKPLGSANHHMENFHSLEALLERARCSVSASTPLKPLFDLLF